MPDPVNGLLAARMDPELRRRIGNALLAAQFDRETPQDSAVTERAGLLPLGTYANGQTGPAWPGIIATPVEKMAQVLRGEITPGTPEFNEAGFDIAGAAMVGGLAAARPRNSVGTFAGRRAQTADQAALAKAEEMTAQGMPREQIWKNTGWFRGVDGKWKWEIDDSGAAVFPGYLEMTGKSENSAPFRDRMMHTNYLNAYPDAENLNIQRMSGRQYPEFANKGGYFDRQGLWIDGAQSDGGRSIALHEIQHDAQMREGFARGGNMRQFTQDEIAAERARILQLDDGNSWTRVGNSAGDMADSEVARRLYNRLAGEVEARAVQKRMDMTPEQRRARPPWLDYDVPEANQIVNLYANARPGAALGAGLSGVDPNSSVAEILNRYGLGHLVRRPTIPDDAA